MSDRITWVDAARGMGISLIFLGHVWSLEDPSRAYEVIYSFHVPLFFFLSGITLSVGRRQRPVDAVRHRARTLLLPYAFYGLLGYAVYLFGFMVTSYAGVHIEAFDYGLWQPLAGVLFGTLGEGGLVNSPVWFLTGLFSAFVMLIGIRAAFESGTARTGAVLIVFVLGLSLAPVIRLPFSLIPATLALIFLHAGAELGPRMLTVSVRNPARWLIPAIFVTGIVTLLSPLNGFMELGHGQVGQPGFYLLFAVAGIGLIVLLASLNTRLNKAFAVIGRWSLAILVTHMLVIKGVQVLISMTTGLSLAEQQQALLPGLLVLAISAALTWPVILIARRLLPPVLTGQPHQKR